jgi:hypothetical protein
MNRRGAIAGSLLLCLALLGGTACGSGQSGADRPTKSASGTSPANGVWQRIENGKSHQIVILEDGRAITSDRDDSWIGRFVVISPGHLRLDWRSDATGERGSDEAALSADGNTLTLYRSGTEKRYQRKL